MHVTLHVRARAQDGMIANVALGGLAKEVPQMEGFVCTNSNMPAGHKVPFHIFDANTHPTPTRFSG